MCIMETKKITVNRPLQYKKKDKEPKQRVNVSITKSNRDILEKRYGSISKCLELIAENKL